MLILAGSGCVMAASIAVKMSACFRRMVSGLFSDGGLCTRTPLDSIWEKVGRVEVGKLVMVGEENCLLSPDHCSDGLIEGDKFVMCIGLFG